MMARRHAAVGLLVTTLMAAPAGAQRLTSSALRPTVSTSAATRMPLVTSCQRSVPLGIVRFFASMFGAWALGFAPYAAIDDVNAPDRKVKGDAGYQPNANTAYAVGSWVGASLGAFAIGGPKCGSLLRAVLGAAIPSIVLMLGREEPYLVLLGMYVGAPLQALGASLAYPSR